MRVKKIVQSSTNRGEFNRAYKDYLETTGKIHCAYCRYNRGENYKGNHYCGRGEKIKYPNWKLTSKNPKQWMGKSITIETETLEKPYRIIDPSGFIQTYTTYTIISWNESNRRNKRIG